MNRVTPAQLWPEVAPQWMLNLPEGLEDLFYRFYKSLIFDARYEMYGNLAEPLLKNTGPQNTLDIL